jgi:hypothetical protein
MIKTYRLSSETNTSISGERRLLAAVVKTAIDDVQMRRFFRVKSENKNGEPRQYKIDNSPTIKDAWEFLVDRIHDIHSIYGVFEIPRDRIIAYLKKLKLEGHIGWIPAKYEWIMNDS